MKKYALEHLDDLEYEEAWDQIYHGFKDTLIGILDEWIERGMIDESDKERALKDWSNNGYGLLPSLLGGL